MSFNRTKNEPCKENDEKKQNVSLLNYVVSNLPYENNSCPLNVTRPANVTDPREYNLYAGLNQGMASNNISNLVEIESELFNRTRHLSECPDKKYKPNDCHKDNSECNLNQSHYNPALDCSRIFTNVSKNNN